MSSTLQLTGRSSGSWGNSRIYSGFLPIFEDTGYPSRREKRTLVTLDFDFSDIRKYPPQNHSGIVIFKSLDQSKKSMLKLVGNLLRVLESEQLKKSLWIVEANRIRIRT